MEDLYQSHFGLKRAPFKITPDPGFLYLSSSHREALAQLSYGITARKGFVVLTGEVGTGKTTLVHSLLSDLPQGTHTALVFNTVVNAIDLLRYVCEEFKLVDPRQSRSELHDYLVLLNEFLLEKYRSGENCVLIIDEAQNLSAEVLEFVRVLSNFETSTDKLLQILLVGQPELAARLNTPELRQLKQRVTLRYRLRALNFKECQEYIANRLHKAGGNPAIVTPAAVEAIYHCSNGIPRLVNILCDNSLLTSYAVGKYEVDAGIVREVAQDLSLTPASGVYPQRDFNPSSNGVAPINADEKTKTATVAPFPPPVLRPLVVNDFKPIPVSSTPASSNGFVPAKLLQSVTDALTAAMGPMARIIIREQMSNLKVSTDNFPRQKFLNLIESVSQEICGDLMRAEFRQEVAEQIRNQEKD